jgi:hypothetical protein
MNDAPKLLVEWSSPWQEFVTAIRPAFGRSQKALAGEARTGLFPYSGMLASWVFEGLLLLAAIILPAKLASMQPYTPPPLPKYDVIYFSGDELPRTEDAGGAQAGRSGRAGGHEAHHRTQTIRVARENKPSERVVDAPKLNLPRSEGAVANLLAFRPIPGPAPSEGLRSSLPPASLPQMSAVPPPPENLKSSLLAPRLPQTAVAPPPQVGRDRMRTATALNAGVIAPAPTDVKRDVAAARVPVAGSVQVVPPPVSAPERDANLNAKLLLPAPSVVAPPPAHVTRELGSVGGSGVSDIKTQVVPPPVQVGGGPVARGAAGGIAGSNEAVVPPPVQGITGWLSRALGSLGGSGNSVVPPPPAVNDAGSGTGTSRAGIPGGTLLANSEVVPPPPSMGGGTSPTGRGRGNKGSGMGGPGDIGLSAAAPSGGGGGNGGGKGIVVSSQPGSKLGIPGSGGNGSLAMSPAGGDKSGLGGSGGGSGIGRGNGPGSGLSGEGSGAGREGSGLGSDPKAHGGISPYPGTGGAGRGTTGTPAMPGVSVAGGSGTISLPSFGSNDSDPSAPGHSSLGTDHHGPGITVIGTSRSGGAFNFYDKLKGDNYTIYIPTSAGYVVMQFADPNSAARTYMGDLAAPEPMRADLPAGLTKSRIVLACILDRSGQLQKVQVLEKGDSAAMTKIMASLPSWKFRPAMRNAQPVEVNAILGFNIDTR